MSIKPKKLRLGVDALTVEAFATGEGAAHGTVNGYALSGGTDGSCQGSSCAHVGFCPLTCADTGCC